MPKRLYQASTGYVGGQIRTNLWLWIGVFAVLTVVLGLIRWGVGHASIWGDALALSGMILGLLVIIAGQRGHAPLETPDEG